MLIHFAFGSMKQDTGMQVDAVMNTILSEKRLKYSKNREFIPVFQPHLHPRFRGQEVFRIPLESFKVSDNLLVASSDDIQPMKPESEVYFLPDEINMICFIKITFNKLKSSPHSKEYGKLGLVFTEEFLKKQKIESVSYYEEKALTKDPIVIEWNMKFAYKPNLPAGKLKEKSELETQILAYRKPASLFDSFRESRRIAVRNTGAGIESAIEDAYARYPFGYNFRDENEWRIASKLDEYMDFEEENLSMVIVPNEESKQVLERYFKAKWTVQPAIRIFPQ